MIFQGLAPSFMGTFADTGGRRPAYIIAFAVYTIYFPRSAVVAMSAITPYPKATVPLLPALWRQRRTLLSVVSWPNSSAGAVFFGSWSLSVEGTWCSMCLLCIMRGLLLGSFCTSLPFLVRLCLPLRPPLDDRSADRDVLEYRSVDKHSQSLRTPVRIQRAPDWSLFPVVLVNEPLG
jgi:hypothetical protein